MISNPKIGRVVQVWYREGMREHMPHHGRIGIVRVASRAKKARNHMIDFGGLSSDDRCAVPAGNLRDPQTIGELFAFMRKLTARGDGQIDIHWTGKNIGTGSIMRSVG